MMEFASDNTAPAHPLVWEALQKANSAYQSGYGNDALTEQVKTKLRTIFDSPEAAVYLVATGTAANALAIATFTDPWGAVFCHTHAHVAVDECGAPEFFTGGAKLVLVDGEHGRMTPDALRKSITTVGQGGVHGVQRGMVSLTNATEAGTIYTAAETAELCQVARDFGLPVHLDGARFANALVSTNASPADLTWRAGVDVVSFGGTKNGLLGVEAVVIFDPAKAWEFELRRKRGGHLFSKHRYLAAQMDAYLTGDLWLTCARQANQMALGLSKGLRKIKGTHLTHPTQANSVFAGLPRAAHRKVQAKGAHYYFWPFDQSLDGPDDEVLTCRLVCSWSTREADVDQFLHHLQEGSA
jgi:threonine aldolase